MKESYIKPIAELEEFKSADIIATSGITDDNDQIFGQ